MEVQFESKDKLMRKISNIIIYRSVFNILILAFILGITIFFTIDFFNNTIDALNVFSTLCIWWALYYYILYVNNKVQFDINIRRNTLEHYTELKGFISSINKELKNK